MQKYLYFSHFVKALKWDQFFNISKCLITTMDLSLTIPYMAKASENGAL